MKQYLFLFFSKHSLLCWDVVTAWRAVCDWLRQDRAVNSVLPNETLTSCVRRPSTRRCCDAFCSALTVWVPSAPKMITLSTDRIYWNHSEEKLPVRSSVWNQIQAQMASTSFCCLVQRKMQTFSFCLFCYPPPPSPLPSCVWRGTLPATLRRRQSLNIDHTSTALFPTGQTDSAAAIFGLLYHISSGELFFFFPSLSCNGFLNSKAAERELCRITVGGTGDGAGGGSKPCSGTLQQHLGQIHGSVDLGFCSPRTFPYSSGTLPQRFRRRMCPTRRPARTLGGWQLKVVGMQSQSVPRMTRTGANQRVTVRLRVQLKAHEI